ncbi:hypothetical protein DL96DRAFT_1599049 [Flagelloscypha sp. PMI_526]|nr:hypothetical protein DL96DRAFT_1599049 [Flagelloscypha sp. PMI_526]
MYVPVATKQLRPPSPWMRCSVCHGPAEWSDTAGSAVCTQCGTLADSTQVVLAPPEAFGHSTNPAPLKSGHTGWTFAGQNTAEVRHEREMQSFVLDLARQIRGSGSAERASALLVQVMEKGSFQWGRKGRLVSAACLAIAFREDKHPYSLREISSLIQEPYPDLSQTFSEILLLLNISLEATTPAAHIPSLHASVASFLETTPRPDVDLSKKTIASLQTVSLHSVSKTAVSLADFLVNSDEHRIRTSTVQPTAVAVFILSLEAELREPFSNLGEICAFLGKMAQSSKSVVMTRYKAIQECIGTRVAEVGWLNSCSQKKGGKQAARTAVIRGLKEVLCLHAKIATNVCVQSQLTRLASEPPLASFSRKRQTLHVRNSTHFLQPCSSSHRNRKALTPHPLHNPPELHLLPSFLLSSTDLVMAQPSRLQLLCRSRGGHDNIRDEELFEKDELDGLFRTQEEIETLSRIVDWPDAQHSKTRRPAQKSTRESDKDMPQRSSKIDYAVYDVLMGSFENAKEDDFPAEMYIFDDDKDEDESGGGSWRTLISQHLTDQGGYRAVEDDYIV